MDLVAPQFCTILGLSDKDLTKTNEFVWFISDILSGKIA